MIKVDDKYMTVEFRDGVLFLIWKEETKDFTDDDFKTEASKFIDVVEELDSKKILVDMRKFGYQLSEDLINWRKKNIISIYNEIGVEKFAFISEKPAVKQDSPENTFVTMTFVSSDEAVEWLKSD